MSKRNMAWLAVIIAVGMLGWLALGWLPGLIAAAAVLIISEFVERRARARRRGARQHV